MAETPLSTSPGGGSQTTTQSPQTAGSTGNGGGISSEVQPGTASDLLKSQNGIQLKDTPLTTVSLAPASSSAQTAAVETHHHHINPALGAFSITLFVVAVVLFWLTSKSAKTTTK